ncbi:MAG: diacylglycerol kinase family lipid kinase [Chloroflexi bacterium]|nr:diacylglycerol kinase family lipid kinase [Chloroflexota bacterium]
MFNPDTSFVEGVRSVLRNVFGEQQMSQFGAHCRYGHVEVIINPAAGQDRPILNTLNTVFNLCSLSWNVAITNRPGDGKRLAAQAVERGADLVAVYGGDGTVMEAASGMLGSGVPMAILPGGTANVMAVELGIPRDLASAAALAIGMPSTERCLDVGMATYKGQELPFILRAGIGAEAMMVNGATREMKDRMGTLAYTVSALSLMKEEPVDACFTITIDGHTEQMMGPTLLVGNSVNVGFPEMRLIQNSNVNDGLLDVVVVQKQDVPRLMTVLSMAANMLKQNEPPQISYWQGQHIIVDADPPQPIVLDGELIGETPFEARVLRDAVRVIVPDGALKLSTTSTRRVERLSRRQGNNGNGPKLPPRTYV